MKRSRVYLAGQPDEYANNWKAEFKELEGFEFHDWELDSDQTSPDTFFPDDLKAVSEADYLVANPRIAPSEGTWIEVGYFLALNTEKAGDRCGNLIIIWPEARNPKWSIDFVCKAGIVVESVQEAKRELVEMLD